MNEREIGDPNDRPTAEKAQAAHAQYVAGKNAAAPPREHIMQFFAHEYLPTRLQEVSAPFGALARVVEATLPRNPERTVALRKLLEAKDAAVRALLAT